MGTAFNQFFCIASSVGFIVLAGLVTVLLPGWWGMLFAPGLIWCGYLVTSDVVKPVRFLRLPVPAPRAIGNDG